MFLLSKIVNQIVSLTKGKKFKRRLFEKELKLVKVDNSENFKVFAKLY